MNIRSIRLTHILCLLVLFGLLLSACGPDEPETVDVGVVSLLSTMDQVVEGFKTGMTEAGYTEGENINYVYPGATNDPTMLESAAQDLVAADVDLILCITTPACLAAMQATAENNIPIVFVAVTDPINTGLVQDWAQPGGNITGITTGAKNFTNEGRRLQWLLQMDPDIQRVFIPYNPDDATVVASLAAVSENATDLGVELVLAEVRSPEEASATAQSMPEDVDALFLLADRVVVTAFEEFANACIAAKMPFSSSNPFGPELTSYGSDFSSMGTQASRLANQILKGTPPADLPVEAPEFFLVINAQTAEAIGLEIPEDVYQAADQIVR